MMLDQPLPLAHEIGFDASSRMNSVAACFDADVVDGAGTRYLHVSGYRTVTFREDVDARVFRAAEPVMA